MPFLSIARPTAQRRKIFTAIFARSAYRPAAAQSASAAGASLERPGPSARWIVGRLAGMACSAAILGPGLHWCSEAGSALAEGTTPLTAANFDDFVEGALAAGKTAMVRFIASEG